MQDDAQSLANALNSASSRLGIVRTWGLGIRVAQQVVATHGAGRCRRTASAMFATTGVFDGLRVGGWLNHAAIRRCLTPEETLFRRWLVNAKAFRISRQRPDRAAGSGVRAGPDLVQRVLSVGGCIDVVKP
jgi:hypothetical protein